MSFNGGINLFFHFGVVFVAMLILPVAKIYFEQDTRFSQECKGMSILFLTFFYPDSGYAEATVGKQNQQKETKVTKGWFLRRKSDQSA